MSNQKQQDFTVTDRRKFTVEGDVRPDTPPQEDPAVEAPPKPEPKKAEAKPASPPPPVYGDTGYNSAAAQSQFGGEKIEFLHLVDLLVQTAMMYAGAMETGPERRVDIVGLRQMIDMLGLLQEKTKGNLSEQEEAVLGNTLFQMRMTYMEIINMIQQQAAKGPGNGSPKS
jgi:hypothetical protein